MGHWQRVALACSQGDLRHLEQLRNSKDLGEDDEASDEESFPKACIPVSKLNENDLLASVPSQITPGCNQQTIGSRHRDRSQTVALTRKSRWVFKRSSSSIP
jgi:hypothetical protein